jgi:predicted amidophosphoribosyltransferase
VVNVGAWCGHCGESFPLAELVAGAFDGRCPRCGAELVGDGYLPVASTTVHDVLRAAAALDAAAGQLRDVAPRLHVDGRKLRADLAQSLGD